MWITILVVVGIIMFWSTISVFRKEAPKAASNLLQGMGSMSEVGKANCETVAIRGLLSAADERKALGASSVEEAKAILYGKVGDK